MYAADKGHVEAIRVLIAGGTAVDNANNAGHTALMVAAFNGHAAAIRGLLTCGEDVNKAANNGGTALMAAAWNGHAEAAAILLDNGARWDSVMTNGKAAFDLALEKKHFAVLKRLLDKGARVTPQARQALSQADRLACTILLADPHYPDPSGLKPALLKAGSVAFIDQLMALGKDWQDWLRKQGFAEPILAELHHHFVALPQLWQALAGPGKSLTEQQKRLCCAGILAELAKAEKLKAPYSETNLSDEGEAKFHAMLKAQVDWLAAAGEALERQVYTGYKQKLVQYGVEAILLGFSEQQFYDSMVRNDGPSHVIAQHVQKAMVQTWKSIPSCVAPASATATFESLLQTLKNMAQPGLERAFPDLMKQELDRASTPEGHYEATQMAGDSSDTYFLLHVRQVDWLRSSMGMAPLALQ
jgi:hypothetical protein